MLGIQVVLLVNPVPVHRVNSGHIGIPHNWPPGIRVAGAELLCVHELADGIERNEDTLLYASKRVLPGRSPNAESRQICSILQKCFFPVA